MIGSIGFHDHAQEMMSLVVYRSCIIVLLPRETFFVYHPLLLCVMMRRYVRMSDELLLWLF
jgi:CRP-like cAMP-binding protein